MSATPRKGVLLRLTPDMLKRVDQARGAMNRTQWLTHVIERRLLTIEEPRARDANYGALEPGSAVRRIWDEDGSDTGLAASAREDGVLEISLADVSSGCQAPDAAVVRGSAASGGSADDPKVPAATVPPTSTSRSELGDLRRVGWRGHGESEKGSGSEDSEQRPSAGSPPQPYDPYEF